MQLCRNKGKVKLKLGIRLLHIRMLWKWIKLFQKSVQNKDSFQWNSIQFYLLSRNVRKLILIKFQMLKLRKRTIWWYRVEIQFSAAETIIARLEQKIMIIKQNFWIEWLQVKERRLSNICKSKIGLKKMIWCRNTFSTTHIGNLSLAKDKKGANHFTMTQHNYTITKLTHHQCLFNNH